ncbi:MAG: hypothetical protein IKQ68_01535 [Prevotella sp.]|nr:hypothetical protein [Prevotella sp.]
MKNKILYGFIFALMAVFAVSCSDDDYAINTNPLLGDNSVVTGTADVTPVSAIVKGSVSGLDGQAASSYATGFYYGTAADNLTERVQANSAAEFTASISGEPGQTIYYQAFVTLQGRLTYKGDVKSLILTDATATTGEASNVEANKAMLVGSADKFTADSKMGILISSKEDAEAVRNGVKFEGTTAENFDVTVSGLLPNTTYYYTAYVDLGGGVVYGQVKQFTTPAQQFDVDNDLVDLGLSTKWARYNLGASSETELGGLFGFGDMTGFNTSVDPADYASADIYKTAQDVANQVYGGKVTMPTIDEFEELFRCCEVEWQTVTTADGEVGGYKFTGPNGNSIFMPAAGSRTGQNLSGVGTEGHYLSGSINPSDNQFAMSYLFTSGGNARSTTPVYQALSVRPVSVAKNIPFDKTLLYKTWEIDLTTEGECKTFSCPIYFYMPESNYNSVTNCEPIVGSGEDWLPGSFNDISWLISSADQFKGYITFNEDGTASVSRYTAAGTEVNETGTYTVDEENKTITLTGLQLLAPAALSVKSFTTDLRILSLTDKSMQISLSRADDGEQLSINMIPQLEKYGYTAKLICYGQGVNGDLTDGWNTPSVTVAGGQTGTYTITFNTTEPRANGQVYCLDIVGFHEAYPNAFVKIDAIKADGQEVKFDANKFFYGDIESNGNFRIEMANIWGKGHNDDWNGLADTPFHPEGGETTNETALAFNETFEVTFTIVSLDATLEFNVKQTAVGLDSPWATPGNWGKENPAAIKVENVDGKYQLANTDNIPLTLNASECENGIAPANGAVNLVDVVGIRSFFDGFSAELLSVNNDGSNVPFTAANLKTGDLEGNGNFRIELHNIWGTGTADNPAFGGATTVEGNNVVTSLGFSNSTVYTIGNFSKNLFALPW